MRQPEEPLSPNGFGEARLLGDVLGVGDYEAALKHSEPFKMSFGTIRMLDLKTLIAAKEAAGRDKDKYAVRLLRAVAEKKQRNAT